MFVKKFESASRMLSILFKIMFYIMIVSFIAILTLFILKKESLTMPPISVSFPILAMQKNTMTQATLAISTVLTALPLIIIFAYIFVKSSSFFEGLSKGQTPFSEKNYKLLKNIAILLMITSLIAPLLYSLIASLNMKNGYYIMFGIDSDLLVGLIIYCMAEIIRYGVTLQQLSDDTV